MNNLSVKVADAELEILRVLWANCEPMTDKQIRDTLGRGSDWKRTTIQTLIKRLLDKEALAREKRDVYYYRPTVTEEDIAKSRTLDLLDKVYGGSAKNLVSAMLGDGILSEKDIDELKDYWRKGKNENE